jgi:hypothetical protein
VLEVLSEGLTHVLSDLAAVYEQTEGRQGEVGHSACHSRLEERRMVWNRVVIMEEEKTSWFRRQCEGLTGFASKCREEVWKTLPERSLTSSATG